MRPAHFAVTLLLLPFPCMLCAQERDIRAAQSETNRKIELLFQTSSSNPDEILRHADKTVLLGAYWKYLTSDHTPVTEYQKREYNKSQFIGFITGMSGVKLPSWWETSIIEERTTYRALHSTDKIHDENERIELKLESKDYQDVIGKYHLPDFKAALDIEIARPLIDESGDHRAINFPYRSSSELLILVHQTRIYVLLSFGLHEDGNGWSHLIAFNRNGTYLWQNNIWGVPKNQNFQGPGRNFSRIDMALSKNSILVFGVDEDGTSVESFSSSDGRNEFRFSTSCYATEPIE